MARKVTGGIGETLKTIVYAIVIALFIRTFFYEPFSIPSASMVPTLLVGDYLFVSKFSYGYSRYSPAASSSTSRSAATSSSSSCPASIRSSMRRPPRSTPRAATTRPISSSA
jgi:hypothetical protein